MPEGNRPQATPKARTTSAWDPTFFIGINQQALENWSRCVSALTAEIGQFVQARLQEDLGVWARLSTCKDLGEAFECQNKFIQKVAADYFDEASKLSRLTMNMTNGGLAVFSGEARDREKEKAAA